MITRKEKREREKNKNFFFEFVKIQRHFFKEFTETLKKVKDPRHQSYITYGTETVLYTVLLKNVFGIESMRSMTDRFNKEECIENIKKVLDVNELEELPHYDTINDFLSKLDGQELEDIRTYMIKTLFKKRCFESYRILGQYWPIVVDGSARLRRNTASIASKGNTRIKGQGKQRSFTCIMYWRPSWSLGTWYSALLRNLSKTNRKMSLSKTVN